MKRKASILLIAAALLIAFAGRASAYSYPVVGVTCDYVTVTVEGTDWGWDVSNDPIPGVVVLNPGTHQIALGNGIDLFRSVKPDAGPGWWEYVETVTPQCATPPPTGTASPEPGESTPVTLLLASLVGYLLVCIVIVVARRTR